MDCRAGGTWLLKGLTGKGRGLMRCVKVWIVAAGLAGAAGCAGLRSESGAVAGRGETRAPWDNATATNQPAVIDLVPASTSAAPVSVAEPAAGVAPQPAAPTTPRPAFVRRTHLRLATKAVEQEFLSLVQARQSTRQELTVLGRLLTEKTREIGQFNATLAGSFGVQATHAYRYDNATRTVYELAPQNQSATATNQAATAAAPAAQRAVKKLETPEAEQQFYQLVGARDLSTQQTQALRLLQQEKLLEAERVERQLAAKFAISRDRQYQYDAASKTLFEFVPVPAGAQAPEAPAQRQPGGM